VETPGAMVKRESPPKRTVPKASRPYMPGYEMMFGKGLLPWSWAVKQLSRSHNYWIATVRSDGRPHLAGVWGVWLENMFYFTSGEGSRKARNIHANPNVVLCPDRADRAVIVEGVAKKVAWSSVPPRFRPAYKKKYDWDIDSSMGPAYVVRPRVVFGIIENAGSSPGASRWRFR